MNKTQNIFSQFQTSNNTQYISSNLNFQQNSNFINNNSLKLKTSSLTGKIPHIIKKRNYNELMESYKNKYNNLYIKENEEHYKALNMNFKKNIKNLKPNPQFNCSNEVFILNNKKNKTEKKKEIKLPKRFIIDDDIDDVEKDFAFEKDKKVEKKYKLSKSYLYDEESGFYSDLDDTKENSFSSLNFSFDYPDMHFDHKIKDKLISNAIELEKTFNRFFNVKNMPNRK